MCAGHVEVLKALLEAKAHVNALDKKGFTPLHLACQAGSEAAVSALCEAGANTQVRLATGALHHQLMMHAGMYHVNAGQPPSCACRA